MVPKDGVGQIDEGRAELFLKGIDIPACPEILIDIDRELRSEAPNQREIARLISKDVALSGRVMRIANSPAFGTGRNLDSIMQALSVLGSQQMFNLVVTQLLKMALAGPPDVKMDRFWDDSARTARVSAELARKLKTVRPERAYTFSLFHDCGIPLMLKRFPEYKQILSEANQCEDRSFTSVEEENLGTSHSAIGYFLARRWMLPDFISRGILVHHDYGIFSNPGDLPAETIAVVATNVLSEHITRVDANLGQESEWVKSADAVCDYFDLSLGEVDDLIEDMRDWLD
jgi:HD-like signal output (HDOD) protein